MTAPERWREALAQALISIKIKTASGHVSTIMPKLGAANRTEAAVKARALGLDHVS